MVSTKLNDRDSKLIVRDRVVIEKVGRMNFPNHPTMMECGVHTIMKETSWKLHGNIGWNGGFKSF